MRLVFDIGDDDYVSVNITADKNEDELELHNLSNRLLITNPASDVIMQAKYGAYNHLSEEQYKIFLEKIKSITRFFNYDITSNNRNKQATTNIFLLLERLINAYINKDNDDYRIKEGGIDNE